MILVSLVTSAVHAGTDIRVRPAYVQKVVQGSGL